MCDETGALVHAGGLELHRGRRSWVIPPDILPRIWIEWKRPISGNFRFAKG